MGRSTPGRVAQKFPMPFRRIAMHYGEPINPEEVSQINDDELLALVANRISESIRQARIMNGKERSDK